MLVGLLLMSNDVAGGSAVHVVAGGTIFYDKFSKKLCKLINPTVFNF
jgi:hypothetical protein